MNFSIAGEFIYLLKKMNKRSIYSIENIICVKFGMAEIFVHKNNRASEELEQLAKGTRGLVLNVYGSSHGFIETIKHIKKYFIRTAQFLKKKIIYGSRSRAEAIVCWLRHISFWILALLDYEMSFCFMKKGGPWTPSSFIRCITGSGSCGISGGGGPNGPQHRGFSSGFRWNENEKSFEQTKEFNRPVIAKFFEEFWNRVHAQLLGGVVFSTGGSVEPYFKDNHELFIIWDGKIEAYHIFVLKSNPLCNGERLAEEKGMFFVGMEPLLSSKMGEGTFLHYVGPHDEAELKKILFHERQANGMERAVDNNNPREVYPHIRDAVLKNIRDFDYSSWAYRFHDDSFAIKKSLALAEKLQGELLDLKDTLDL